MTDAYKHDAEGTSAVASSLRVSINDYNDRINELLALIEEINSSPSWKDVDVKNEFMSTCNSYMTNYNKLIGAMTKYVDYLEGKTKCAHALEEAYMR